MAPPALGWLRPESIADDLRWLFTGNDGRGLLEDVDRERLDIEADKKASFTEVRLGSDGPMDRTRVGFRVVGGTMHPLVALPQTWELRPDLLCVGPLSPAS